MTHVSIVASPLSPHHGQHTDLVWDDEAACQRTAGQLAQAVALRLGLGASLTLELHGTLGAGKTTFTRHLLRALGVTGRIKSPSYAVVEPHELPDLAPNRFAIHHFDFYRFNDPQEWEDAGFRDIFGSPGLKVVEWPEKAAGLLPVADLQMHLDVLSELEARAGQDSAPDANLPVDAPPARRVRLQAGTAYGQSLLAQMALLAKPDVNAAKEACHG